MPIGAEPQGGTVRLRAGVTLVGVALAAGATVVLPSAATAAPVIHVAGTDGQGVIIRGEPNRSSARLGWVGEGQVPQRHCATIGESVGNVSVWFYVTDDGISGYIPSYYDDSSYSSLADLTAKYGIPECGSTAPAAEPVPSAPVETANPTYNRSAAAEWAQAHARDGQGNGALCTWFVSQALWAGGLPSTPEWQKGTRSSTWVGELVDYLWRNDLASWYDITANFSTNAVPEAEVGDVIVYDWEGDNQLDHAAFVVNFAPGQYPEVSEQGQLGSMPNVWYRLMTPSSPYVKRGWTYSELHHQWLQKDNASMRAYLLHINGGYLVSSY